MDDLLSAALSESGLDEFFADNETATGGGTLENHCIAVGGGSGEGNDGGIINHSNNHDGLIGGAVGAEENAEEQIIIDPGSPHRTNGLPNNDHQHHQQFSLNNNNNNNNPQLQYHLSPAQQQQQQQQSSTSHVVDSSSSSFSISHHVNDVDRKPSPPSPSRMMLMNDVRGGNISTTSNNNYHNHSKETVMIVRPSTSKQQPPQQQQQQQYQETKQKVFIMDNSNHNNDSYNSYNNNNNNNSMPTTSTTTKNVIVSPRIISSNHNTNNNNNRMPMIKLDQSSGSSPSPLFGHDYGIQTPSSSSAAAGSGRQPQMLNSNTKLVSPKIVQVRPQMITPSNSFVSQNGQRYVVQYTTNNIRQLPSSIAATGGPPTRTIIRQTSLQPGTRLIRSPAAAGVLTSAPLPSQKLVTTSNRNVAMSRNLPSSIPSSKPRLHLNDNGTIATGTIGGRGGGINGSIYSPRLNGSGPVYHHSSLSTGGIHQRARLLRPAGQQRSGSLDAGELNSSSSYRMNPSIHQHQYHQQNHHIRSSINRPYSAFINNNGGATLASNKLSHPSTTMSSTLVNTGLGLFTPTSSSSTTSSTMPTSPRPSSGSRSNSPLPAIRLSTGVIGGNGRDGGGGGGGVKVCNPKRPSSTDSSGTSSSSNASKRRKVLPDGSIAPVSNDPSNDPSLAANVDEEEDLGCAETYAEYKPTKLRSGLQHPDMVVETSSLASVPPPNVRYHVSIPEEIIDTGKLSALQLEAIIYACQMQEQKLPSGERCGYLIGDGAGVGKGRTVAGIIFENYLLGRKKALWFSISSDLKYDSERDLKDIGASRIKVFALNKLKYSKINGKENGSIKKGVLFSTYSSLIGESHGAAKIKYKSRLRQIKNWCGEDFDGVIIFDECHRAKNLMPIGGQKPTKTGAAVLQLQKELPNARVVYASATGATEPRNMAYMTRLGLWGEGRSFFDFNEFISAVERRGVGAMEIVAMDMKQRGLYLARQLSFNGVSFKIQEVPLSKEFIELYDKAVKLWLDLRVKFQQASELIDGDKNDRKSMWGQFWACHQRFFKYLCIASKVRACVIRSREAIKNGKSVVIGLQSTGEARTLEAVEEAGGELNDFVSTAKGVMQTLIEKHFPSANDDMTGFGSEFYSTRASVPSINRSRVDLWKDENFDKDESGNTSSSESENDDDDDDSSSSLSSTDPSESEDENKNPGNWLDTLMQEAKSSDEEDNNDSSDEDNNKDKDNDEDGDNNDDDDDDQPGTSSNKHKSRGHPPPDDDDFNPFAQDLSNDCPWADKQQVVDGNNDSGDDSPLKQRSLRRKKKKAKRKARRAAKRAAKITKNRVSNVNAVNKERAEEFLSKVTDQSSDFIKPSFGGMGNELCMSRISDMKAELLVEVEKLGESLPPNTLDQLIQELGGPEAVAEMTGRKGRVVSKEDGEIAYELRNINDVPLEVLNLKEKERFMNGQKKIAIISEAASSGISLQADRRAENQGRRVHITLELPWSADKAIQQFGRTHRSNQVSAPEYLFLISELAGEKRFASVVAKRLESLGALTHGDRRATESRDLSQFNLDTKFGRKALEDTMKAVAGHMIPRIPPPSNYPLPDFFADVREYLIGVGVLARDERRGLISIEREAVNLPKFLNRLLGLPVHAQNALFQYFSGTLEHVTEEAKRDGRYDQGILDLGIGGDNVSKKETRVFLGQRQAGSYRTELHTITVERGYSWEDAYDTYMEHNGDDDGFYQTTGSGLIKRTMALICSAGKKRLETGERLFNIYRPNTGIYHRLETMPEIKARNYKRVNPDEAQPLWEEQYKMSGNQCQHVYHFGQCRTELVGVTCEVGKRNRQYYVLSGSVLSVWPLVEKVLNEAQGKRRNRMQVIRVKTWEGNKIVGVLIPSNCVRALTQSLEDQTGRSYIETSNTSSTSSSSTTNN